MTAGGRVIVIDGDEGLLTGLCSMLSQQGYDARGFSSWNEALEALREQESDILLADLSLPDIDRMGLIEAAQVIDPDLEVIIMAVPASSKAAVDAIKPGAFNYIEKPFKPDLLMSALSRGMETRRLRKENSRLRQSEKKYRQIIETLQEGIWVIDGDAKTIFVNPRLAGMFGYEAGEMQGMSLYSLITENEMEIFCLYLKHCRKGERAQQDFQFRRKSGDTFYATVESSPLFDENGNYSGLITGMIDITDRKKLQEQFFQSQKMEAIGALAGGIAHDFNNILAAIIGNMELLKLELPPECDSHQFLSEMESAGHRASELVNQLLHFSRPEKRVERILPLEEMVNESLRFLRAVIPSTIRIRKHLCEDCICHIKADPSDMTLIITNLTINARDAMPQGGTLQFLIEVVDITEDQSKVLLDAIPGKFCMLSVKDSGIGMAPHVKERIFEPFFTTKGKGEGTGLGLAMVYSTVKQLRGWISVYSEPGQGTEFKIYIPLAMDDLKAPEEEKVEIRGGSETILLADDEDMLRKIGKKILERYGYKVILAGDGDETLRKLGANKDEISLAILDLTMPGGGGLQLMKKIQKNNPGMAVIISSGYSGVGESIPGPSGKQAFLQKPFSHIEMARIVREVLDKSIEEKREESYSGQYTS